MSTGRYHFLILLIITVGSGIGGAFWSLRKLKQEGRFTPTDILKKSWLLPVLAFLPLGVWPAHYLLAIHPEWQWNVPDWVHIYYDTIIGAVVLAPIACVFGFAMAAYLSIRHPHRWFVVALGGAFLGLMLSVCGKRPNGGQLPELLAHRLSKDGVILQSTSSTCVPAAVANILAVLGKRTTEKELADLFGTTLDGTSPAQVVLGMRRWGIETRKRAVASDAIQSINAPALLFVSSDAHVIAFMGMTNQLAEVWDPSYGKKRVRPEYLKEIWSGHTIEFSRTPGP